MILFKNTIEYVCCVVVIFRNSISLHNVRYIHISERHRTDETAKENFRRFRANRKFTVSLYSIEYERNPFRYIIHHTNRNTDGIYFAYVNSPHRFCEW